MVDPARLAYAVGSQAEPGGPDEVERWERKAGGAMPAALRALYAKGDGGPLRDSQLVIRPVGEGWSLGPSRLAPGRSPADPARVVRFAATNGEPYQREFLLDYNDVGSDGEPAVYGLVPFNPKGVTYRIAETLDEFLGFELAFDPAPCVDLAEAEEGGEVLARIAVESTGDRGEALTLGQVLVRREAELVLFLRGREGDALTLERISLPLPLAERTATICTCRETPSTYSLLLPPDPSGDVGHLRSVRAADGAWRNTAKSRRVGRPKPSRNPAGAWRDVEGSPSTSYARVFSPSRDELVALRMRLLGAESAARAATFDRLAAPPGSQEEWAYIERMMEINDRMPPFDLANEAPVPEGLRRLEESARKRVLEAFKGLEESARNLRNTLEEKLRALRERADRYEAEGRG